MLDESADMLLASYPEPGYEANILSSSLAQQEHLETKLDLRFCIDGRKSSNCVNIDCLL